MRTRLLSMMGLACATVAFAAALAAPGAARAADCTQHLADLTYNGACGPQFELPAWGDGAGWTDPSKYSTIQLADLTGNGVDELIARNDDGIEIWYFDTQVGQWRPAVDPNGRAQVLTDFASPSPSESGPSWLAPQYYTTIQTAALDGPGRGADIIARFPSGLRVYHYTPPAGTKDINRGTWKLVSKDGPFSDADGYTEPALYLSIHAQAAGDHPVVEPGEVTAQSKSGPVTYFWTGSGWIAAGTQLREHGIPYSADPADYLNLKPATLATPDGVLPVVTAHTSAGVVAYYKKNEGANWHWQQVGNGNDHLSGPFPSAGGFGSSPSYYTTLQFANVDGKPGDEVLAREAGGLMGYTVDPGGTSWAPLGTLTDLKGAAHEFDSAPGRWASIRTGDVLGNGRAQVLALDGSTLATWSYDPASRTWSKLKPSAPLDLGGDMWDKDASYYSTIQVGDVTGTGKDAVIARGPYGIRTWFYDLRPNSGWTGWLPQDSSSYPQFSGGQAQAFAALNALLKSSGAIHSDDASLRDVWTSENAPSSAVMTTLHDAILRVAQCPIAVLPYPAGACAAPKGFTGFDATDWTAVINEILAEMKLANDDDDFFTSLDGLRQSTFLAHKSELDTIAGQLDLQSATETETTIDPEEIGMAVMRIVGSLVEEVPGAGALLEGGAELMGMLDSTSSTFNSEFRARYVDLQDKITTMNSQIDKGVEAQSHEVRASYGLLSLVKQLTTGAGAWSDPDKIGLESVNDRAFSIWVYKQLLPTMYQRYTVTGCVKGYDKDTYYDIDCDVDRDPGSKGGAVLVGAPPAFSMIGAPSGGGWFAPSCSLPRPPVVIQGKVIAHGLISCRYVPLGNLFSPVAEKVWGPLSQTCDYRPGNEDTKWTFGDCNAGVSKENSVTLAYGPANGWDFTNRCGNPDTLSGTCAGADGSADVGENSRVTLGGSITLPAGFNVTNATIAPDRLLYEPAGPDGGSVEVVDRDSGQPLGAVRMSRHGRTDAFADPGGGVRAKLELSGPRDGERRYDLTISGIDIGVPNACQSLSAADALATPPFTLTSTLALSDGNQTHTVHLPAVWHCVRDRTGEIGELRPTAPRRLPQRPGLAVSLTGPRILGPGASFTYKVRVRNRRPGPRNPTLSSLWHVAVQGAVGTDVGAVQAGAHARTLGAVRRLRRGRSATLGLRVHVPRSATGRICVGATAIADSARPAAAHLCARITRAPTGGLG